MKEREQKPRKDIQIEIPPEFTTMTDPEPGIEMLCSFKHPSQPTGRRQIPYSHTYYGMSYAFPKVWANVCGTCDQSYFAPEVGTSMLSEIQRLTGVVTNISRQ